MTEEEQKEQQQAPRPPRAAAYNPELVRLGHVGRLLEGKATLQRPTREMIFEESFLEGLKAKGINLKGCLTFSKEYREMSPGINGKGIDGAIKVLTPQPTFAVPGSVSDDEKVGFFTKIICMITGKNSDKNAE